MITVIIVMIILIVNKTLILFTVHVATMQSF